jgi:two-component system sensor histidine kinase HydH
MGHLPPRETLPQYRSRTRAFALLNLAVVAALFLLQVLFVGLWGPPRPALLATVFGLVLVQFGVLVWVEGLRQTPEPRRDATVALVSIGTTLGGATLASYLGQGEDHHYFVLMFPAIVLAAFRFGWWTTIGTVLAATALTMWEVLHWFRVHPPLVHSELFETSTTCLLYAVVGVVVHLLALDLHRRTAGLAESLERLERAQEAVVAGEKLAAVGRLASAIAHEFRNPVAVIHSSLATAERGGLDPAARAEMHAVAMQQSERLERLTGDFLAYAHTREPQRQETGVADTLAVVAHLLEPAAEAAGVSVAVERAEGSGRFDPFLVHRALLNLATNAVQHTPRGGTIRLAGVREDGGIAFSVANPGEPVPREAEGRVFEPFFTTREQGTGLGLAIARSIAHAHGGDSRLARNEPGDVRFVLTLADAEGA